MKQELISINANLVDIPTFLSFKNGEEKVEVANFTLVKKYGNGREYINCSVYGKKVDIAKAFLKGDLIHVYGYFRERVKDNKTYRNFIIKSYNKIKNKEKQEE